MTRAMALGLLAALSACERDNGAFCDDTHPCATGTCNLVTKECEGTGIDGGMADILPNLDMPMPDLVGFDLTPVCPACSGTTPICEAGACVSCTALPNGGEAACAALSPTTPHCLGTGACAQCRDGNDCSDPSKRVCDATTHTCRGCTVDSECASLVCDLTTGSGTIGQCVSNVIYVNCLTGDDNKDGKSLANANKKISKGIANAKAAGYPVVRISSTAGGACNGENLTVMDNITLVGETGATISAAMNNNPAVDVKGNTTVVFRNLIFSNGMGTGGNGITCETSGTGSLTVLSSTITDNDGYGIYDMGCVMLAVDRSLVGPLPSGRGSGTGGIYVSHNFRITNSFIIGNGSPTGSSGGGIAIASTATATVRDVNSNTVVGNFASGVGAGVSCPATALVTIVNNILFGNLSAGTPSASSCPTSYCGDDAVAEINQSNNVALSSTVTPGFVSASDYHITAGSPLRGKGAPSGISDHDYDGQPRPDTGTGKSDIGADEFYP